MMTDEPAPPAHRAAQSAVVRALMNEILRLRDDIERIGEELATQRNANAELQERLSDAALDRIAQLRGAPADALNDDPERIEAEAHASARLGTD